MWKNFIGNFNSGHWHWSRVPQVGTISLTLSTTWRRTDLGTLVVLFMQNIPSITYTGVCEFFLSIKFATSLRASLKVEKNIILKAFFCNWKKSGNVKEKIYISRLSEDLWKKKKKNFDKIWILMRSICKIQIDRKMFCSWLKLRCSIDNFYLGSRWTRPT